jgi:nicotine blue oxidoreductase
MVVVNEGWSEGIGSSLRAGLGALEEDDAAGAVVVALADQPLLGADAVGRLVAAWRGGAVAAVATFEGEPRNPVLLDRSLWAAVRELAVGYVGARGWLRRHPEQVTAVPCDDVGSAFDIDTPEDLAALAEGRPKGDPWN